MRLLPIWTLALAGLLLTTWPAAAQMSRSEIDLRNQIYDLQQQVAALRQQMAQGGGGSYLGQSGYPPPQSGGGGNDLVPQLLTDVQSLESQMRDLRGKVDELQNQVNQQNADLNKRIGDLGFQMQNGGPGAGAAGGEMPPPAGPPSAAGQGASAGAPSAAPNIAANQPLSPPPAALGQTHAPAQPPPPAPAKNAEQALRNGEIALDRRDYPAAETAAREVLNRFRISPRAYDAQFLLAESLAGQRQFAQAAIAYDDTYNRSRKGVHAPAALIGLAYSLSAINEKRAACDTLTKLHNEFPHQAPEIHQAAATIGQRAACR